MKGAVTRSPLRQRGRAGTDPGKKPVPAASRCCRAGIAHSPFFEPKRPFALRDSGRVLTRVCAGLTRHRLRIPMRTETIR